MQHFHVFIGELEDTDLYFRWNTIRAYYQGNNLSYRISDIASPVWRSADAVFNALIKRIESGVFIGEQVDQGCWVAVVTSTEISCFINELHSKEGGGFQYICSGGLGKRMDNAIVLLHRLDPGKIYVLVGRKL
jgi:hypothetical protein